MLNKIELYFNRGCRVQIVSLMSFLLLGGVESALSQTWVGLGTDGNWSTAANWDTTSPASASTTVVTLSGTTGLTSSVDTAYTVKSIVFASGSGAFNVTGQQISLQGTDGTLDIVNNSTTDQVINNNIKLLSNSGISTGWNTAYGTLTVNGNVDGNGKTLTFANSSTRAMTVNGIVSGASWVQIYGAGYVVLNNANTVTSGMAVSGKLIVNGSLATSANALVIQNAGLLGGKGVINKSVTIQNGGILSAGEINASNVSQANLLTLGSNLTLNNTSKLKFDLGTASDLVTVAGNLTLDGSLDVTAMSGFDLGSYTLFSYTGTLTDNTLDLGTMPSMGYNYSIDTSTIGLVKLNVVPEPKTWALCLLATAVLIVARRRRVIFNL